MMRYHLVIVLLTWAITTNVIVHSFRLDHHHTTLRSIYGLPVIHKSHNRASLSLLKDSTVVDSTTSFITSSNSDATKTDKDKWISRIILLVVSAFYGTNFGCVKILGDSLDGGVAAALRFFIAFLVFSPQLFKVIQSNPKLILGGFEIGFYTFLGYWAQSNALITTNASSVAFICSLQVIVVPIIDLIMEKSRRNIPTVIQTMLPATLAVVGVACLELGGSDIPGFGDLWALVQPVTFGIAFWRIERIMKLSTKPGEAQAFTASSLLIVFLMSCVWAFSSFIYPILHEPHLIGGGSTQELIFKALHQQMDVITTDWKIPAALLWTGIITTAITTFGENIAMKNLDAAESTVIYSTEPLWGTAFAAVTLGENIGWNTLLGALFILTACAWRSVSVQVASVITSLQISYSQGFEEVSENIMTNLMKILEEMLGIPPHT